MKAIFNILIVLITICLVGCATPNYNGIDAYSFIPGGSTYKHVKKEKNEYVEMQVQSFQRDFDYAEYLPKENVIKVQANNESATVGVDVLGSFSAMSNTGGIIAILFDIIKGAAYYFAADKYVFSSSSNNDNKEKKEESPYLLYQEEVSSDGEINFFQIEGEGNNIYINTNDKELVQ